MNGFDKFKFAVVNHSGEVVAVFRNFDDAHVYVDLFVESFNLRYFILPYDLLGIFFCDDVGGI